MKRARLFGRRTKIVATIGPATSSAASIGKLVRAGVDVVRLNLSHGTFAHHKSYVETIRTLSERLGINVAILMDLPGPKYRIGALKGGQVLLKKGSTVTLTTRPVEGTASLLPVNLPNLAQAVRTGDTLFLADGALQIRVESVGGDEVTCRVLIGGVLTPGRGLAVPGNRGFGPFLTDVLRENLLFAIQQQPDFLALSFVGNAEDVLSVKAILKEEKSDIPVIAKIERGDAVANFDRILAASDGVMVARGDLGVEIPLERVPLVQKEIIRKCNRAGKPVITATEMLESMVHSPRPTRAEATDVANAIFDGTDATMLSAETAIGQFPVQAVRMMARIAREAERRLPYEEMLTDRGKWHERQTDELISYNACYTAHSLGARAIVAFTESGSTAGRVSKYRPRVPILALTPDRAVLGRLLLHWGVHPIQCTEPETVDELFATGVALAKALALVRPGDLIVITGGIPIGVAGTTNMLKVEKVG
ncbi:MAG: pyruvate kinase [Chloroflexi bacterium]|nr:pyruvate kinase [Chloroflexota bacterium]